MTEKFYVTDTHPLLWYIGEKDEKLPKKVRTAFRAAEDGNDIHIWVPSVVVWEMSCLMRKTSRITMQLSLEECVAANFYSKNISVLELEIEDVLRAHGLTFTSDPFDALIVATAIRIGVPLITGDSIIHSAKPCTLFWD